MGFPIPRVHLLLLLLLSSGLVSGCATTTTTARGSAADITEEATRQQSLAMKTYWRREMRLQDLAWPLLRNAADLCAEDAEPRFGIIPVSLNTLPKDLRETARTEFGITEQLQVRHVIKGSPVHTAGLEIDDKLVSIGGVPSPTGKNSAREFVKLLENLARSGAPVAFEVERDGVVQTVSVMPETACGYGVALVQDDVLNAFADGKNIYMTQGMMRFTETDAELQLIIAHEISHNSEGHIKKKMGNSLFGTLLDIVAAGYGVNTQGAFGSMSSMMFSQDFEREADYVGMYILARSDVSTIDVADFWRRLAAEHPSAIRGTFSGSHPATAERFTNIEATHQEIMSKLSAQLPLVPERK